MNLSGYFISNPIDTSSITSAKLSVYIPRVAVGQINNDNVAINVSIYNLTRSNWKSRGLGGPSTEWLTNNATHNGSTWYEYFYGDNIFGNTLCFQETANVSTSCGGLSTGNYTPNIGAAPYPQYNASFFYDENWSTYAVPGIPNSGYSEGFKIIYYKPAGANINSIWQYKKSDGSIVNFTFTSWPDCWNAYSDRVIFRVYHVNMTTSLQSYWDCEETPNAAWKVLTGVIETSPKFYEEAIYWNISATADWNTQGGDYDKIFGSYEFPANSAGNQYYNISLNVDYIKNWINNPSSEYGWIIKSDETTYDEQISIGYSSSASSPVVYIETIDYITPVSPEPNQIFSQDSPYSFFSLVTGGNMDTCYWNENNKNYTMTKNAGFDCYQETANISTTCGGLSTGTYSFLGTWSETSGYSRMRAIDGDWSLESFSDGPEGTLYINYSKPTYAINATWQVKDGNDSLLYMNNLTLPSTCFSLDPIRLKINATFNTSNLFGGIEYYCWNTTNWQSLRQNITHQGGLLYEEAIYWNITNSFSLVNTTMNDGTHTISYWCNLSSDGSWKQSSYVNFQVDSQNITTCRNLTTSNRNYYLNTNISSTGDCFHIYASNVTFDCNGNWLRGPGAATTSYGIFTNGYSNITIQNCNISNFGSQIFLNNSNNNQIKNSYSNNNAVSTFYGIRIQNSNNTQITNWTVKNSNVQNLYAIHLTQVNNSNIWNSTIASNTVTSIGNAIYAIDSNNDSIYSSNLTQSGNTVNLFSTTNFLIQDTIISSTVRIDRNVNQPSNNILLNTSESTWDVPLDVPVVFLKKQWYVTFNITNSAGSPISGAFVDVYNSSKNLILPLISPPSGMIYNKVITEKYWIGSSNIYETPHIINVSMTGYTTNSSNLTVDSNKVYNVKLSLTDNTAPNVQIVYPTATSYYNVTQLNYTASDTNLGVCWYTKDGGVTNSTPQTCGTNWSMVPVLGSNTWRVYANDTNGNLNYSQVTFNVDWQNPNITLLTPANNTQTNNANQNFSANFTDNLGLKNYTLYIYNTTGIYNQTSGSLSGLTQVVGIVVNLMDGVYNWFFKAFDNLNNEYTSVNYTITVDTINPLVSIVYPTNITYYNISELNYTTTGTICKYSLNGAANQTITCGNNVSNLVTISGSNTIILSVEDAVGNKNSSSVTFTIDRTNPNITLLTPSNNTLTNNPNQNFTANISDNLALDNYTLYIYNTTGIYNQTTITTSSVSLIVGIVVTLVDNIYTWFYEAFDSVNNRYTSENRTITIDLTSPAVSIIYPTNNSNYTSVTSLNFTTSATTCKFSNNSGQTNTTISCSNYSVTADEGLNNWTLYVLDLAGNSNSSTVTFRVDSTAPTLNIVYPTATTYGVNNFSLNYTVSDSGVGLDSCWYRNDTDAINITIPCGTNTTISNSDGTHTIYMWANDTLGNLASDSVTYSISTSLPAVSLDNPTANQYFNSGNNIRFNATVTTSDTPDTCELWGNWSGWHLNQTVTGMTSGVQFNFNLINLSDGNYTWNVWCNNSLGNAAFSSFNRSFVVDTVYPQIDFGVLTPADGSNLSQSSIYINTTWTELNFQNITFRVNTTRTQYLPFSVNAVNFLGLANGIYYINVTICDKANNCNTTATRTITLDTTNPTATLNTPANNTMTNIVSQNLSANLTDNLGIKNASLYINGVLNSTISYGSNVVSTTVGIVLTFADGVYNWFYRFFDWSGNTIDSETRRLTIDTINPSISIVFPINNEWYNYNPTVNYTVSDTNTLSCKYSLNGAANQTITCGQNISDTWLTGNNNITVYATDLAGNINSSTVSFNINLANPLISFGNGTETNNSYFSRDYIYANVSITESNIDTVTFTLYNSTGLVNRTLNTLRTINWTNLPNGVYYYNVTVNNSAGNSNSTETRKITLDTVKPSLTIISPQNISYTTNEIYINATSSETVTWNATITSTIGQTNLSFTMPLLYTFTGGSNTINITATDLAGNSNSSKVTFYVNYNSSMSINAYTSIENPEIGYGVYLIANVTSNNTNITNCIFSLSSPSTNIFNARNGSYSGGLWNSQPATLTNEEGIWNWNVTCTNEFGENSTVSKQFEVEPYVLYILSPPQPYYFAAEDSINETKTILVSLYDSTIGSIYYNVAVAIDNQSYFSLNYTDHFTLDDDLDNYTNPYSFNITLNASDTIPYGIYSGNITLTNTILGTNYTINFSYGIRPPASKLRIWYNDRYTQCTDSISSICAINPNTALSLQQGSSITYSYWVSDVGDYLSGAQNCSVKFTNQLANANWISASVLPYSLSINEQKNFQVIISPSTSVTAGIYSGNMYVYCTVGNILNMPVTSPSTNNPPINIQVIARQGGGGGGGGGGGVVPNITNASQIPGLCGNGICEPSFGENYASCQLDCTGNLEPLTDCWDWAQGGEPGQCILRGTAFLYIAGFITLVLLLLLFLEKKKKSSAPKFTPVFTLKKRRR